MAAEKPAPVRVLYCGVCGLPAEYCEFGPDFERCKPWLRANAPGVYPDELLASSSSAAADVDKVGERLQGVGISAADGSTSAGFFFFFPPATSFVMILSVVSVGCQTPIWDGMVHERERERERELNLIFVLQLCRGCFCVEAGRGEALAWW